MRKCVCLWECEGHHGQWGYHRHNLSLTHTRTHTHTLITLRAVSTLRFNNTRCQLAERTAKLSRWNSLWCRGQAARLMGMEYSHAQPIRIGEMAFQEHAFISGGVKKHRQKKRHLLAPPCSNKPLKSGLVHRSDRAEDEVILGKKKKKLQQWPSFLADRPSHTQ